MTVNPKIEGRMPKQNWIVARKPELLLLLLQSQSLNHDDVCDEASFFDGICIAVMLLPLSLMMVSLNRCCSGSGVTSTIGMAAGARTSTLSPIFRHDAPSTTQTTYTTSFSLLVCLIHHQPLLVG
jgi:hypothetical protein